MKTNIKMRITTLLLILIMSTTLASCGNNNDKKNSTATAAPTEVLETESPIKITEDRQGNAVILPEKIERIMVAGPSNGEILSALGFAGKIVAADKYSTNIEGINSDIPLFDMDSPDVEQIIDLNPDIIFVTGMVQAGGDDPYKPFKDAGICIIYLPSSASIEGIKEDIRFMGNVLGSDAREKGATVIKNMEDEIEKIKTIGDSIADKKSVYFEISAAPYMYSFGTGVFLSEMLDIIGATNILADQKEWIGVADEMVMDANPDVILTSVNYIDNPIDEIKERAGWNALTAVANDEVYYIDTDASNRPSQNIIKALKEMAIAIYPNEYK